VHDNLYTATQDKQSVSTAAWVKFVMIYLVVHFHSFHTLARTGNGAYLSVKPALQSGWRIVVSLCHWSFSRWPRYKQRVTKLYWQSKGSSFKHTTIF